MNYNFIFFYVDTFRPEISNQYIKIERESIGYFIDSIKKSNSLKAVLLVAICLIFLWILR